MCKIMLSVNCENPKSTALYKNNCFKETGDIVNSRVGRELVAEAEIAAQVNVSFEKD